MYCLWNYYLYDLDENLCCENSNTAFCILAAFIFYRFIQFWIWFVENCMPHVLYKCIFFYTDPGIMVLHIHNFIGMFHQITKHKWAARYVTNIVFILYVLCKLTKALIIFHVQGSSLIYLQSAGTSISQY
jgi:hypothetical protein